MKKFLTLIAAASMSLSLFAADIFAYVPLASNIKSYTKKEFAITSKFGNYFRSENGSIVRVLNNLGKEVEISELDIKGNVINKIVNIYDVYGNLTEQNCYDINSSLLWKNQISYKDGKKSEVREFDNQGKEKARTIYIYKLNEETKLPETDESIYSAEGALLYKTIYKYNENNILTSMKGYTPNGLLDSETTYAYKDDGKIDSITYFDSLKAETTQEVFRYDANNTISEVIKYNNNKEIINRTLVKYDTNGNISKITSYDILKKFDTTVNELVEMSEYSYNY